MSERTFTLIWADARSSEVLIMADVSVTLGIQDSAGVPKTVLTRLPSATTLAQAQGFVTSYAALVDTIVGGVVTYAEVTLPLTLPGGIKSTPDVSSTVHRGGLFGYDNPSPFKWSQYLPSLVPSLFTGELVNIGDDDVAAYITAMEDGVTVSGTPIQPTNGYGDDLTTNTTATESFRK